jgi:hypothetical protein
MTSASREMDSGRRSPRQRDLRIPILYQALFQPSHAVILRCSVLAEACDAVANMTAIAMLDAIEPAFFRWMVSFLFVRATSSGRDERTSRRTLGAVECLMRNSGQKHVAFHVFNDYVNNRPGISVFPAE